MKYKYHWLRTLVLVSIVLVLLLSACKADRAYYSIVEEGEETYYVFKQANTGIAHDIQYTDFTLLYEKGDDSYLQYNTQKIMTLKEYSSFCKQWKLDQQYNEDESYIVIAQVVSNRPIINVELCDVEYDGQSAIVYLFNEGQGYTEECRAYTLVVPVSEDIDSLRIQPVVKQLPSEMNATETWIY